MSELMNSSKMEVGLAVKTFMHYLNEAKQGLIQTTDANNVLYHLNLLNQSASKIDLGLSNIIASYKILFNRNNSGNLNQQSVNNVKNTKNWTFINNISFQFYFDGY